MDDTGRWLHSAAASHGLVMLFYDFGISYLFFLFYSAFSSLAHSGRTRSVAVYQFWVDLLQGSAISIFLWDG